MLNDITSILEARANKTTFSQIIAGRNQDDLINMQGARQDFNNEGTK